MAAAPSAPDRTTDAILDAAIELAVAGGFEQVRQRDVAARAGVALGTLYKRFPSKEALLVAAMDRRMQELERRLETEPPSGKQPRERLRGLFRMLNDDTLAQPNYARAVVRATASSDRSLAGAVTANQTRVAGLVIAAMRGRGRLSFTDASLEPPTAAEIEVAMLLLQLWFAILVGWAAGLFDERGVRAQMERAIDVVLKGTGAAAAG